MQELSHDKYSSAEIAVLQQATRDFVGLASATIAAASDLTVPQMRLLFAVHDRESATCSMLAHDLDVSASSVTRLADRLAGAGLIERAHSPRNRTLVFVSLTDSGRRIVAKVLERRADVFARALGRLDDRLRSGLIEGLWALSAALKDIDELEPRHA